MHACSQSRARLCCSSHSARTPVFGLVLKTVNITVLQWLTQPKPGVANHHIRVVAVRVALEFRRLGARKRP